MQAFTTVGQQGLRWLRTNEQHFELPKLDSPDFLALLKPVGELALNSDVLIEYPALSGADLPAQWLAQCWTMLGSGEVMLTCIEEHPDLVVLASIYPPFAKHGMRHIGFERAVAATLRLRGVQRLEFPPWRCLELSLALAELGLESPWDSQQAYSRTWLAGRPEPWTLCESSAYSLTHTVFYMTDFGRRPARLPVTDADYLVNWLPVWFERFAGEGNYDLAAELSMTAACIGTPQQSEWAEVIAAAQRPTGVIPGPRGRGGGLAPNQRDAERRSFLDDYHTTLVSVMASAMAAGPSASGLGTAPE